MAYPDGFAFGRRNRERLLKNGKLNNERAGPGNAAVSPVRYLTILSGKIRHSIIRDSGTTSDGNLRRNRENYALHGAIKTLDQPCHPFNCNTS